MWNWISEHLAQWIIDLVNASPVAATFVGIVGSMVFVCSYIILLTPTKSDDDWWTRLHGVPILGALLTVLERFSVFKRRE